MKMKKQLVVAGVAVSALGLLIVSPTASATYGGSHDRHQSSMERMAGRYHDKNRLVPLASESNEDVKVSAKLDRKNHLVFVKVKNMTDTRFAPEVTFNGEEPTLKFSRSMKPDKSATYFWVFSGNNFPLDIKVADTAITDLTVSTTVNVDEPISFVASNTTDSTVEGTLTNNSAETKTVYVRANNGDKQAKTLEPGESQDVIVGWGWSHHKVRYAYVSVSDGEDYRGAYWVKLDSPTDTSSH